MKYKIIIGLTFIFVVGAVLVTVGKTGSDTCSLNTKLTGTVRDEDQIRVISNNEKVFEPIFADNNALATTISTSSTDVLIAPDKAKAAPALAHGRWINSEPLTLEGLRGRVVLVDFWTYGCYNCINTLPALKKYDTKYRDQGLTIVGVETPETESEGIFDNLNRAVSKRQIKYPVVTDNDGESWRAFGINAWPTVVILDKQSRIRYIHVGEGEYEMQEKVIQTLLAEDNQQAKSPKQESNDPKVFKTDDEWRKILTPDQFYVLREKGTEPPFSGEYNDNHQTGDYYCAACHLKLFSYRAKFDSGTGWPSFYQPVSKLAVIKEIDNEYETVRTEILCSRCHSHLGHVFKDGPKPTGLRYCMNSTALKFETY